MTDCKNWIVPFMMITVLGGCATSRREICPQVAFAEPSRIRFTDNEEILLCGDPSKESWKEIPPAQAEYTLRNLLRQRGYFSPQFKFENNLLTVAPGEEKLITSVEFNGQPVEFDEVKLRRVVGSPLTSEALDRVQQFALSRLKKLSYACPEVKITAEEKTGVVRVTVHAGKPYVFQEPTMTDSLGMYEKTMRRFDAFQLGSPYQQEWITLTSQRAENDGIVISSELNNHCPADGPGLPVTQKLMGADKRLITIGAGASTEEFPIAEVRFKSVRLDDVGSNLALSLYGSQRRQTFRSTYTKFPFKNAPRFDFAPRVTVEHRVERTYNTTDFEFAVPFEYRGDGASHAWYASLGPAANRIFSVDDTSKKTLTFFSLIGRTTFTSHDFELYQSDPRSGWMADFSSEIISSGFELAPLATVLQLNGTFLFGINAVDPPQWILGFRYGLSTVSTEDRATSPGLLPAKYYLTLGGDQNLRGFGRNELNQGTIGGLTSFYLGTELRYAKTLPLGIEPFAFLDWGALGATPFQLDPGFFYSPGIGVRCNTPIGTVRGTVAHGFLTQETPTTAPLSHVQLFFSFGKEF